MFKQNVTYGPGTGSLTVHTFEILIMLLGAFLLGLWLGWLLWGKYKQQVDKLLAEQLALSATNTTLREEISRLKTQFDAKQNENQQLQEQAKFLNAEMFRVQTALDSRTEELNDALENNKVLDTELGLALASSPESFAVPMEVVTSPVDLHVEELAVANIETENTDPEGPMNSTPEEELSSPVLNAPAEPQIEKPTIEPVAELSTTAEVSSHSEVLATSAEATEVPDPNGETTAHVTPPVIIPSKPDDLKIVEGIGPKIEEILFLNGILTYKQLAATPVNRIKEILLSSGPRFAVHDPGTWPAQALLAANAEWDNLKAYQSFLNAGKRPS